jgi:hypothetical protein
MRTGKAWAAGIAALAMLGCSRGDAPVQGPDANPVGEARFDVTHVGTGTGSIGGTAFIDLNGNGIYEGTDLANGGIAVYLEGCSGNVIAVGTTASDGTYLFDQVNAGNYVVRFEKLDGLYFVPRDQGSDECADSDVDSNGKTICFANNVGEADLCFDAGQREYAEKKGLGCRVTGGGVDEYGNWDGTYANDQCSRNRYTFGGQAGANTALPPQPAGEWQHHQQNGPDGSFSFHGGTHSAPDGTLITRIVCSDPGFCDPARPAPAKQIDFWGIGIFHNARNLSPILEANVVVGESLHWFEVNIDDTGEPGKGKGVPRNCPSDGFGLNGSVALVDCSCADFYRITIRATTDPASPVIYSVWGYINGGNLQIHPLTGFDSN